jgi:hypothetical protein
MLPAVQVTSELAPRLREIVSSAEGGLLPLSALTDEQLVLAAKAIQRDWPIQLMAQQLYTYKVKSQGLTWSGLLELMPELKRRIKALFSADDDTGDRPESIDPVSENAALIRDLRTEYDLWTVKVREAEAPTKAMMEHVARLGKLLQEAITHHATIRNKMGLVPGSGQGQGQGAHNAQGNLAPSSELTPRSQFSAENMQVVFTGLSGNGMSDFLEAARSRMELEAKQVTIDGETTKIKGKLQAAKNQVKEEAKQAAKQAAKKTARRAKIAKGNTPKRPPGRPKKGTENKQHNARTDRENEPEMAPEGPGHAIAEAEEA